MISINWVKDYIDIENEDLKELATKITKAGVNIEDVISNHIDNLVIGKVVECIPHPDSDHLHVCQVDVGQKDLQQIVCGAQNVKAGIKVIVALPGSILPGNFEIKAGKIRGQESNGMICAKFELGLEEKTEETYAKGIEVLPSDAEVGTDPIKFLGLEETLYDVDIHKHRNNDCYYHIGFAYEIGTILGKKVKLPLAKYKETNEDVNDYIKLEVDTKDCPYYLGKMVRNVKIGESPEWMQKRLISAGMRPINNVVDISNFVMLEYGQPTHFFDADKLGKKVLVRNAKEDEEIITLDGNKRILKDTDIVITDGKKPTCIAGIMGGENIEVDESTKNIFIEAAIFDAAKTRITAQRLGLKSEASIRYGKGLNFEYTNLAMDRCCSLLEEYASGKVCKGIVLHDKEDKTLKEIDFEAKDINRILGIEITDEHIEDQLHKLDFEYTLKDGKFHVIIPRRRLDVEPNVEDLAEEIGRLYGYHNLVSTLPNVPTRKGVYVGDVAIRKSITKRVRALGLTEVKTYNLVSPSMAKMFKYEEKENIILPNPMSIDKSVLRTTLIPSLLNVYEYNKARKVEDIKIYEIAKTYNEKYEEDTKVAILMKGNYISTSWNNNTIKCDFYTLKGILENLFDYLGFKNRYTFEAETINDMHPGISARIYMDRKPIGVIGKIHPSLTKDDIFVAEISMTELYNRTTKPLKYKQASIYPEIKKDVAFIVNNDVTNKTLEDQIKHAGGRLLDSVEIFDIYRDIEPGKKSMAYNLVFKDATRTLSDEEVMEQFNKIITEVETKLDAKLRGN